jgi:hypothetical protein
VRSEFRPVFGRVLTVAIGVLCGASILVLLVRDTADGLRAAPWLLFASGACWALYWRPHVAVDDGGVHLVNPLRTIDLPWPAILAVDTKFALTLTTAYGRYTGWAAPAPGLRKTISAGREEAQHLPASTSATGGIRPGDLPSSASGGAALLIRRRWEQLRDQGHLDDPRLEHETAPVTWHVRTIGVGAALVVLSAVSLFV